MKQISASIIVLAAAIVMIGSYHFDDQRATPVVFGIGIGICVVGLRGWFISMKEK